jgi:hypothetical protein
MKATIKTEFGEREVVISAGRRILRRKHYAVATVSVGLGVMTLGSWPLAKEPAMAALCAADEAKRAKEAFAANPVAYLRGLGFCDVLVNQEG